MPLPLSITSKETTLIRQLMLILTSPPYVDSNAFVIKFSKICPILSRSLATLPRFVPRNLERMKVPCFLAN